MKIFSALFLFLVSISTASAETGLSSDFGPISFAASRRAVQANIQDWADDLQEIGNLRRWVCASAGIRGLLMGSVRPLQSLSAVGENPSAPLSLPLQDLAKAQILTPVELKHLQRLMKYETADLIDQVRLFIDTKSFLITVSARLYQAQIGLHLQRISGVDGLLQIDTELCAVYSLQAERDSRLIKAAYEVVAFYDFLEQDSAD